MAKFKSGHINGFRLPLGRMNRAHLATWLFFFFSVLFFPLFTHAAQLTLAWDPDTDPNVNGYRVYCGTSSHSYQFYVDVGKNTTITVPNLQDETTYYFAVTAYEATGIESGYSNEISSDPTVTCLYSISPASQSIASSGGTRTVSVSSQPGCAWTAVSNVSWLLIPSNSSGTGSGTVSYSVDANSSSSFRKGKMMVAGQTFTVTQKSSIYQTTEPRNSGKSVP
jgi:hypothetical protein